MSFLWIYRTMHIAIIFLCRYGFVITKPLYIFLAVFSDLYIRIKMVESYIVMHKNIDPVASNPSPYPNIPAVILESTWCTCSRILCYSEEEGFDRCKILVYIFSYKRICLQTLSPRNVLNSVYLRYIGDGTCYDVCGRSTNSL